MSEISRRGRDNYVVRLPPGGPVLDDLVGGHAAGEQHLLEDDQLLFTPKASSFCSVLCRPFGALDVVVSNPHTRASDRRHGSQGQRGSRGTRVTRDTGSARASRTMRTNDADVGEGQRW